MGTGDEEMPGAVKVFYLSHATPDMYAIIREAVPPGFALATLEKDCDEERRAKLADSEVAIVASYRLRGDLVAAAPHLRLVHHQGVGYHDTVDLEAVRARGLRLALTPEGTTESVAEHAVMLMLAACRHLPFADAELRQGRFHINALRPISRDLAGMTIGYVGMGRIGQAVAARLKPFGVGGLYADAVALSRAAERKLGIARVDLETLLEQADIVTLHCPLTPQTRGIIGADAIARMKPGGILVNTARGGLVDEQALAAALRGGRLSCAALDVFETEPLSPESPLIPLNNVVLTPHISAGTRDTLKRKMAAIFANIQRFYDGEALRNEVFLQ